MDHLVHAGENFGNENHFQLLYQNMVQGVIFQDNKGLIVNINSAAQNLLGYSYTQLIGKMPNEIEWKTYYQNDKVCSFNNLPFVRALEGRSPIENEVIGYMHPKRKEIIWFLVSAIPINHSDDPSTLKIFSTFTDISQQIWNEKASIKEKLLQEILTKTSREFINVKNKNLNITINNTLKELGNFIGSDRFYIIEYNFENNTATNTYEWCAQGIPPQIEILQNVPIEHLIQWTNFHMNGNSIAIDDTDSLSVDDPLKAFLGDQDIKSIITTPIMVGSNCLGFVGFDFLWKTHLISNTEQTLLNVFASVLANVKVRLKFEEELVKSEENYKIIANNTFNWEFWRNSNGKYIYHSPACFKTSGYNADELLENQQLMIKMVHPQDLSIFFDHNKVVFKTNASRRLNYRIIDKNGLIKHIEHVCQPVFDKDGNYLGIRGSNIDVSDHKVAEIALQKSEELYRSLIESSDAAIMVVNPHGKYLYVNSIASEPFGLSPNDFIGKHVSDFFRPEDSKNILHFIQITLTENKSRIIEPQLELAGLATWLRASLQPIRDENGAPIAVLMNATNITGKKLIEIKLQESEDKYRALFNDSPEPYFLIDNYSIVECNKAAAFLLCEEKSSIIGKSLGQISPPFQPNNKPSISYSLEQIDKAIELGSNNFEWIHLKSDGSTFIADVHLVRTKSKEKDLVFASFKDITFQKQAEEEIRKFRIISDQANYGSAITTLHGIITYCNETFAKIHGYTIDELIGKHVSILHNEEQLKIILPLLNGIAKTGGISAIELTNIKKDGTPFPTLLSAKLILDNNNSPLFLSSTIIDISERKKIEQEIIDLNQNLEKKILERTSELENSNKQLLDARNEAENANNSKSEFLSRISHELRTPLNSILGFTQLLEMGELNTSQSKGVYHILNSGKHLLSLINEVLDISKIESGNITLTLENVEIQTLLLEVIDSLSPLSKQNKISISFIPQEKPIFVKGDKKRLNQILINLINNAIKYNKNNGKVWISLEVLNENISPNGLLRISVKDNGIGIEEKDLDRIFKPFERAYSGFEKTEGSGLGLAVVKQLIGLMDGFFGVESEFGTGSTFWIELPLINNKNNLSEITSKSIHLSVFKILIIGEKNSFSNSVKKRISNQNLYQIIELEQNQMNLLDNVIKVFPNLILLEIPKNDVVSCEILANLTIDIKTRSIPVIAVCSKEDHSHISNLEELGAKAHLTKPINKKDLQNLLDFYSKQFAFNPNS